MDDLMKPSLLAILCAAMLSTTALQAEERYVIKEDSPSVGTNFRREVANGPIPFDKSYAELTDTQRASLRQQFDDLPLDCEPPFPAHGLITIEQHIIKIQRYQALRGEVFVTAQIDENGKARTVNIYRTPDEKFGKAIAEILVGTEFKPASCGGHPVAMKFPFAFTLDVSRR